MMHPQKNYSSCLRNSHWSSKRVSLSPPSLEPSQAEIVEDQLDVATQHIHVNHRSTVIFNASLEHKPDLCAPFAFP